MGPAPAPGAAAGAPRATTGEKAGVAPRRTLGAIADRVLVVLSTVGAVVPLGALVAMVVILFVEAFPAIRYNGWHFLVGSGINPGNTYGSPTRAGGVLHPVGASYGAWPLILGTLESAGIAVAVGVPIAVGAAIFVVEKLPPRLAAVVGLALEMLAGVPSVVIGLWGVLTFGPILSRDVYPVLAHLPNVPVLDIFRGYTGTGLGLLSSGLVLAIMILPIVAATTRDLLRQVPEATKDAAEALGMTSSEAFFTVQARWIRTGVLGATVLGLGRALGETVAVAMLSGGSVAVAGNIYGTMTTIAATIVDDLDSAQGDPTGLFVKTLAEAALVLLLITLVVNVLARVLTRRAARGASLPVGVGL